MIDTSMTVTWDWKSLSDPQHVQSRSCSLCCTYPSGYWPFLDSKPFALSSKSSSPLDLTRSSPASAVQVYRRLREESCTLFHQSSTHRGQHQRLFGSPAMGLSLGRLNWRRRVQGVPD